MKTTMKEIFVNINKDFENPKEKTIKKGIELLKILWYHSMSEEIQLWKSTIQETCKYLLKNYLEIKQRKVLIELLKISKQCKI